MLMSLEDSPPKSKSSKGALYLEDLLNTLASQCVNNVDMPIGTWQDLFNYGHHVCVCVCVCVCMCVCECQNI